MTIDWCEEHRCSSPEGRDRCEWAWARLDQPRLPTPCLLVPMRLIPEDDLEEQLKSALYATCRLHEIVDCIACDERLAAVLAVLDGFQRTPE